jgi:hypothetical protein
VTSDDAVGFLDSAASSRLLFQHFTELWREDAGSIVEALDKLVAATASVDWLLHLTKKRYRDHKRHQILVGMLGWWLLQWEVDSHGQLLKHFIRDRMADRLRGEPLWPGDEDRDLTAEDVEATWWTAALLHDHAYPLAHILSTLRIVAETRPFGGADRKSAASAARSALESVLVSREKGNAREDGPGSNDDGRLYAKALLKPGPGGEALLAVPCPKHEDAEVHVADRLRRTIASHGSLWPDLPVKAGTIPPDACLLEDPANEALLFDHDDLIFDHGVWAVANIIEWLRDAGVSVAPLGGEITWPIKQMPVGALLRQVNEAIAWHSCTPAEGVNIYEHPMAWLLILCDEMQEWDRSFFVDGASVIEASQLTIEALGNGSAGEDAAHVVPIPSGGESLCARPRLPQELRFRVDFEHKVLDATNWEYGIFCRSKQTGLKRLDVTPPSNVDCPLPLQRISCIVHVPLQVDCIGSGCPSPDRA